MLLIGIHYLLASGQNIDALNLLHLNYAKIILFSLRPTTESLK
jgi:hypothetical protein